MYPAFFYGFSEENTKFLFFIAFLPKIYYFNIKYVLKREGFMIKFKLVLVVSVAFIFSSCSGDDGKDGANGRDGTICTLEGNTLTCGDRTLTINDGTPGNDGATGAQGTPGVGCTMEQEGDGKGPAIITCGNNPPLVIPMCDGEIYSTKNNVCDSKGNLYGIVTIGTQTWMEEDLKGGTSNKFTWAQANEACPKGWSLPSKADFDALVAGDVGSWGSNADDEWWSSTAHATSETRAYALMNFEGNLLVTPTAKIKTELALVRCIRH
jgi:hypothetical protein